MFGVAITTSSISVGSRCPHARSGVGAVATQNVTDPHLATLVLDQMEAGKDEKIVRVENSEIQAWTSSAGTTINAKLVAVENRTTFVFTTKAGRTIRVTADKLSPASAKAARELAGID